MDGHQSTIKVEGPVANLRADYALADLDDAVGLDGNDDGAITWGEVQAAAPAGLAGASSPTLSVPAAARLAPALEASRTS